MKFMKTLSLFCFLFSITTFAFADEPEYMKLPVSGKFGGKIVVSEAGNPKTFNPHLIDDVPTRRLLNYRVYNGLNTVDLSTDKVVDELAKSHTVSEDGLVYTYKIRKGLKWSDGHPFTVEDVIFSWETLVDEKTIASTKESFQSSNGKYPTIKKIDDETVAITLPEVNVLFEDDLTNLLILPKHKWNDAYKSGNFMNTLLANTNPEDVVGMGPYRIKKYVPDQVMILERNPYYWKFDQNNKRLPYLDRLIVTISPDFESSMVKLENGEIDVYNLRSVDFDHINKQADKLGLIAKDLGPSHNVVFYTFNLNPRKNIKGDPYVDPDKLKIFADKRFRQALNYATDRESQIKIAFLNRATKAYSITSPASEWLPKDHKTYPYDIEKAKKMLDEIGLKDQDGDGFRDLPNGKPFQFTIKTNVENKIRINVANLLKEDFSKVGIKANINPVPFNSLITSLTSTYDFECFVLGWGSSVPPHPLGGKNIYLSHSSLHVWNSKAPEPYYPFEKIQDDLIYKMSKVSDEAEQKKIWAEFIESWQEELPQTITAATNIFSTYKKKFKNVKLSVLPPYFLWNIEEIYDDSL